MQSDRDKLIEGYYRCSLAPPVCAEGETTHKQRHVIPLAWISYSENNLGGKSRDKPLTYSSVSEVTNVHIFIGVVIELWLAFSHLNIGIEGGLSHTGPVLTSLKVQFVDSR